jgi:hypothetical protein
MRPDPRDPFPYEPTPQDWAEYRAYLDGELRRELNFANAMLQEVANQQRGEHINAHMQEMLAK